MGALQVPLGSLPEPLMAILGASKTQKEWFLHCKITLFVNAALHYFEALDVLLGPILASWNQSGPKIAPEIHPKITQKVIQNLFQKCIRFFKLLTIFGLVLGLGGPASGGFQGPAELKAPLPG